ncbi:hypothetical protein Sjap_019420 [Stephania japonica]|uniref:Uncharacterized protein n=1 Tax=Stephania japonica TaxID=461633 RepID=A0AAP0HZC1_9MAGN
MISMEIKPLISRLISSPYKNRSRTLCILPRELVGKEDERQRKIKRAFGGENMRGKRELVAGE